MKMSKIINNHDEGRSPGYWYTQYGMHREVYFEHLGPGRGSTLEMFRYRHGSRTFLLNKNQIQDSIFETEEEAVLDCLEYLAKAGKELVGRLRAITCQGEEA